jgi:hypothetical protein
MAAVQTAYSETMLAGVAGMIANMELSNRITRTAVGANIPFGAAVIKNGDHGCSLSAGAADVLLGIAIKDTSLVGSTDEYVAKDSVAIMTQGVIWVNAAAVAITQGQPAYWDETAKLFTNVSTTNPRVVAGWFDNDAATGGLVRLAIRPIHT